MKNLFDYLNTIRKDYHGRLVNEAITCNDGYKISIQCNHLCYCIPQEKLEDTNEYTHFEIGFPSEKDELINEYAEDKNRYTETVYPYVPKEIVEKLINKHGGIKKKFIKNWLKKYL